MPKKMSDGAPFHFDYRLLSLCLLTLSCQNKESWGKKCWDFKEADEYLETIKLSILPCVKTLLRLGNLRDITSTAFISFTGDFLETYLPHSFPRFLLLLF